MSEPSAAPESRGAELRDVASRFRDLAGRRGIPEIVETAGDSLPGATTGHVVYDLGVALALALGDLAEALDVAADGDDPSATGRIRPAGRA